MGASYLKICCCLSFGAIGYTVYERFLQSTGKTLYSTISQVSGAVTNIVLDYVFIYPCKMGIDGAAWATVIGQIVSLAVAMLFHYLARLQNKRRVQDCIKYGIVVSFIVAAAFPIVEHITAVISAVILKSAYNKKVKPMNEKSA